jgi:hypothetical protein
MKKKQVLLSLIPLIIGYIFKKKYLYFDLKDTMYGLSYFYLGVFCTIILYLAMKKFNKQI